MPGNRELFGLERLQALLRTDGVLLALRAGRTQLRRSSTASGSGAPPDDKALVEVKPALTAFAARAG